MPPSRIIPLFRSLFSREALGRFARSLKAIRQKISRATALKSVGLLFIVIISVLVRVMPFNWGFLLSEFDPYFHYDVTNYIATNGFQSWFSWHTDRSWYPFGRDIWLTSFPGLPFSAAALYHFLRMLGLQVSVMDTCIVFPVIMAALTCVLTYFLGKDIGGSEVGLFSALFLALNSAYIGRTNLGFFDDETVGIFGTLLASICFLRSLQSEKSWRASLPYAGLAGLSLGYVAASWGASRYPMSLIAVFALVMLLVKRYSSRLLVSYSITMGICMLVSVHVPKLGYPFLKEFSTLAAFGVFLLMCVIEVASAFSTTRARVIFASGMIVIMAAGGLVLWYYGYISLPVAKFISVLNPFERIGMPLVESVQEHRPSAWGVFYYEFGMLVFLAPLGMYFATQRLTETNLFMVTYALTTLYFSASMVRLAVMMAPAFCCLGALSTVEILRPFVDIAMAKVIFPTRRRIRFAPRVGREFSLSFMFCLFILLLFSLNRAIVSAQVPVTIASASLPVRQSYGDWLETLTWMRNSLTRDTVVLSWWDYGYWITVGGQKVSLADNGTINGTQISIIGRALLSNETVALTMMKPYNVSYVLVYTSMYPAMRGSQPLLYGDEVKWRWMAKIGGMNDTALEDTSIVQYLAYIWQTSWYSNYPFAIPKSYTLLSKLMLYGILGDQVTQLGGSGPERFRLMFSSSNKMVFVYKVAY